MEQTNRKRRRAELTERNYFSLANQKKFISVSQYKAFLACEAAALAEVKGRWKRPKSDALLQGSYIDAYFDGTLNKFKTKNPELFKKDGSLRSQYEHLDYVISRIENQPLMMKLLGGEKQKIMTGWIFGIPVKIKIDSLLPNMIVDLKCMKDFEPVYREEEGRLPWYEAWGYDIQGAIYQEIVYQNTGKRLPFVLVAATKEKEPDLCVLEMSQAAMDFELDRFRENIVRIDAIKKGLIKPERCESCDFCKHTLVIKEIINAETLI